ncbi:MAG: MupA/Atu3671 family FMN-dependent luciferase-like monooxygenase [Myxococcota bacterium]
MVAQRLFDLADRESCLTLNTRCYELGAETFGELVTQLGETGEVTRQKQDLSKRSYFARDHRPAGAATLDFDEPAHALDALVRALDHGRYANPVAVAKVFVGDVPLLVTAAERDVDSVSEAPGTVISVDEGAAIVATAAGALRLLGFTDLEGAPVDLAAVGLRPGASLVTPAERRAALGELDGTLAASEPFWTRRLLTLEPARLAGAAPETDAAARVARQPLRVEASPEGALACVGAWLARTNGKASFDLGHGHPGLADAAARGAGLYADRVPLRLKVDGEASFAALRERAGKALASAEKRGTFLRDLLQRQPDAARPHYDLCFDRVSSLEAAALPSGARAAVVTDGQTAQLVFDADRFGEGDAARLAAQLEVLASAAAADPDRSVRTLPLLGDDEREKVLRSWNATARDFPAEAGIHTLFEEQAARTPDAPALVYRHTALSYAELDRRANQLAHHLRGLGVGPDVPVGLCTDRSLDLVVGALGILKAGGAYVPLDPTYPAERLALMLSDSGAPVVVTQSETAGVLPGTDAKRVLMDALPEGLSSERVAAEGWDSRKLAYLIYTSGSTGTPKGVMVEHRQVANFFVGMDERIARGGGGEGGATQDTWLAVTSLSFDISVLELFWTLSRGFKVVLAGDEDRSLVSAGGAVRTSDRHVDFGLFYFASDEGENAADKYQLLLEGARFADTHGFKAVWTPERHFHAFGGLYPNPSVASAAIAAITENVIIRAGSCVAPLHHPVRIAEEWSLVDNLSNGRVAISFAAGWQPNDFILRPSSFGRQKAQMVEDIDTIRRLWRGEELTFDAPHGKPIQVKTLPRPVQKELPFLITAAGNPKTFEMAGRLGGGVLTHLLGQSIEDVKKKVAVYRQAWKDAGHEGEGLVVLMLHTFIAEDEDFVRETVREPMKGYLRSSMALIKDHAWAFPAFTAVADENKSLEDNFNQLSDDDAEALLDHSFDRYYETSSLFGTPESALRMIEDCRNIGVDEIGCLIDFGVDSKLVMEHLPLLDRLRARAQEPLVQAGSDDDFSIAGLLRRHQVTHMQCTPSMARMLVTNDDSRAALAGLQQLMVGGEAFPPELAKDLGAATSATITNMYGPTETTIWSSTARIGEGPITIGTPIANTQLYVLDEQREPVPAGVQGELFIAGDGVTRGYWKREELTAERFVPDPFSSVPGARMYRTGDAVRWRDDGSLAFLGRIDNQVKIRGYRIELGEIEARLESHPAVRAAVVIAREDNPGDKRLVGYVMLSEPAEPAALKAHLGETLPTFMVPAHLVELDRFPLTPNKKVDRKKLPRPDAQRGAGVEHVAASGETERQIAGVWETLLGLASVGVRDNFFDLGGHSLLAVQAHRMIGEATGKPLTVTDVFRFPTISALAAHLDGDGEADASLSKAAERAAARRQQVRGRRVLRRR